MRRLTLALGLALLGTLSGPVRAEAPVAPASAPSTSASPRLRVAARAFAGAHWLDPGDANTTYAELDRADVRAQAWVTRTWSLIVRGEAVRSAGPASGVGIDGDALVLALREAAVAGDGTLGALAWQVQAGLVEDPWLGGLDAIAAAPELARSASELHTHWQPADLGARAGLVRQGLSLQVAVTNGEGARLRERNLGKNTTLILGWRGTVGPGVLTLAAVGRDGSFGPARTRAHRLGGAVAWIAPRWAVGAEGMRFWGNDARGDEQGVATAAWATVAPIGVWAFAVGFDGAFRDGGGRQGQSYVALGARATGRGELAGWLRIQRLWSAGASDPLPGANADDHWAVAAVIAARWMDQW